MPRKGLCFSEDNCVEKYIPQEAMLLNLETQPGFSLAPTLFTSEVY